MNTVSRQPYEARRWELVGGRTVLILIDPQNDFLHPDGWYAQNGIEISHMQRTIEPMKKLIAAAREKNIPIIWTRHGFHGSIDGGVFMELRPFTREGGLRQGTWGYQVLEELHEREDDWHVEKGRLSAFFNTNLELILRSLHAETVLIGGVLTNQCVAATSKDASFRDFKPIVVAECTGTTLPHLHDPALEMIRVGWGEVRSLETAIADIAKLPLSNSPS